MGGIERCVDEDWCNVTVNLHVTITLCNNTLCCRVIASTTCSNELVKIVNDLFKAVGNPYVAENIDGMLLLAARNLLIESVSFYSYYGKEQIYRVFRRGQTTASRAAISHQIRGEIRKLFRACTTNNKLVLRRMMASAEREFEISVEAIQSAAEVRAIEVVNKLIPDEPPPPPPAPPTLLTRLKTWLFR